MIWEHCSWFKIRLKILFGFFLLLVQTLNWSLVSDTDPVCIFTHWKTPRIHIVTLMRNLCSHFACSSTTFTLNKEEFGQWNQLFLPCFPQDASGPQMFFKIQNYIFKGLKKKSSDCVIYFYPIRHFHVVALYSRQRCSSCDRPDCYELISVANLFSCAAISTK